MGDSYHTDHVHGFTNNSEYECYDRDVTDHVGKCSDGADTPAGTDCAAKFIAADSFEADGCPTAAPDNCTWTKAPVAPNPKPPHPAAASFDGYSHLSGACRSTPADRLFDDSPKRCRAGLRTSTESAAVVKRGRFSWEGRGLLGLTRALPAARSGLRSSHPLSLFAQHRRNTEFPSFPDWANPTALIALCDNLNTLHAADAATNPATCLGFHSGPWVSVFGLNIDQPGPHLPEGNLWKPWDEGSGTIDLTGTKPNHQYVCYIKGNLCPGGIDPAPEGTAAC